MKLFFLILISLVFFNCQNKTIKYEKTIIKNNTVNSTFLNQVDDAEKAIITGYLYAYGNQCADTSTNVKATVLKHLQITNECDTNHLNFLSGWFKNDVIMFYKLKNCPNLAYDSPIQNEIKSMTLYRHNDTLKISILVYGLNNSEEKNWISNQTETFIIDKQSFIKIKTESNTQNESNCLSCQKNKTHGKHTH